MKFCFATFCFGERYYQQVNRFISDIQKSKFKPILVVVTDNPNEITETEFVKVFDISIFDSRYKTYARNYYDFDFSVKRFSVRAAHSLGFSNIILVDADMRINYDLFTEESINESFISNSISGPVTYNFSEQINTHSELGKRFLEYENYFSIEFNKEKLDFMPEDCIQYLSMDYKKYDYFLDTWDKCIEYKKSKPLRNIPAGNIDEMCFSALLNDVSVGNNSNKSLNIVYAQHDKWY